MRCALRAEISRSSRGVHTLGWIEHLRADLNLNLETVLPSSFSLLDWRVLSGSSFWLSITGLNHSLTHSLSISMPGDVLDLARFSLSLSILLINIKTTKLRSPGSRRWWWNLICVSRNQGPTHIYMWLCARVNGRNPEMLLEHGLSRWLLYWWQRKEWPFGRVRVSLKSRMRTNQVYLSRE